jgi:hypothetical protein
LCWGLRQGDWRNGYPGGVEALAEAYGKWRFVLRQYHFAPLADLARRALRAPDRAVPTAKPATAPAPGIPPAGDPLKTTATTSLVAGGGDSGGGGARHRFLYVPLGPAWSADNVAHGSGEGGKRTVAAASERATLCFFAGAAAQFGGTADRDAMLRAVGIPVAGAGRQRPTPEVDEAQPLCEVHLGQEPEAADLPSRRPLSRPSYLAKLGEAVFALCPSGNNPETFRHWESLSNGAIPVSARPSADRSFLDAWCGPYSAAANEAAANEAAANEAAANASAANASTVAEAPYRVVEAESGAAGWPLETGCPVVVLESWDDLPALLGTFASATPLSAREHGTFAVRLERRSEVGAPKPSP